MGMDTIEEESDPETTTIPAALAGAKSGKGAVAAPASPSSPIELAPRRGSTASNTPPSSIAGGGGAGSGHGQGGCPVTSSTSGHDDSFLEGRHASLRGHVFRALLKQFPHSDGRYLDAQLAAEKTGLPRPIGLCQLPTTNDLVVSSTKDDSVRILSCEDLSETVPSVSPRDRQFRRPSDVCALPDGRFAVRDDLAISLFDDGGLFLQSVSLGSRCFGLTTDCVGNLYTISGAGDNPVILQIDVDSGDVLKSITLKNIVPDVSKSRCRFLNCRGGRLYISDLGLNLVYIMDLRRNTVKAFGGTGRDRGKFQDAAGVAVDRKGWMLVADAGNHRIQLFDKKRAYVASVKLMHPVRRPSAILFDPDADKPTIYVLNLNGNSLAKYELKK